MCFQSRGGVAAFYVLRLSCSLRGWVFFCFFLDGGGLLVYLFVVCFCVAVGFWTSLPSFSVVGRIGGSCFYGGRRVCNFLWCLSWFGASVLNFFSTCGYFFAIGFAAVSCFFDFVFWVFCYVIASRFNFSEFILFFVWSCRRSFVAVLWAVVWVGCFFSGALSFTCELDE